MPPAIPSPNPSTVAAPRLHGPLERLRRRLSRFGEFWWRVRARRAQAAYCRAFIAVTGSCGKTTTTLLIERLLVATGAAVKGGRNHNTGRYLMKAMGSLSRPVDFVVREGRDNVASAADLPALARLIAGSPERLVILKAGSAMHLEQVVAWSRKERVAAMADTSRPSHEQRLAAKLRENLKRRKEQARARARLQPPVNHNLILNSPRMRRTVLR